MSLKQPSGYARRSEALLPPATLAGFVLAVFAVLLIGYFSFTALESRSAAAGRVTHTFEVMENLKGVLSTLKDAETGQRGYLLTGMESYLEPYTGAKATLEGELLNLKRLMSDNLEQVQRLESLERLGAEKFAELQQTIDLRRENKAEEALAMVHSGRGLSTMARIREVVLDLERQEQLLLASRQQEWKDAATASAWVTWGGAGTLLLLIAAAAIITSRDFRAREREAWIRAGQMGLSAKIQGEQRLELLGANVLGFLTDYLDAQVGAVYIEESLGQLRRFAGFAIPQGQEGERVMPGEGLLGQAAKENRSFHVTHVPEGYLTVGSSLGRGKPKELLVAPASVDGEVHAVVELGFFRPVHEPERELLNRVAETLGVAVRASKDRTRLEELLEETQRQGEELQTQQEELRVSNEELEEQGEALKESQVRLENQRTELEETNAQLEEQAQALENQKDELSRAQLILMDKTAELERSNQYKSEFLANMSHELRTPLNSSLILAKLLADNKGGNLTEEQVKFAQTISSAGNDLLALINDILDLSKIESGKVEVESEPLSVALVVEGLLKTFQPMAKQKGLEFSVAVEQGVSDRMESDAQRMGQILKNLLSNALKFTEKGGFSLRVSSPSPGTLAFVVRDSGIGIAPHQQHLIFEAFRQADGSIHRKFGGTGLGLYISRDLARLLGGDLVVESVQGEGSVFTLILPQIYVESEEAKTLRMAAPLERPEIPVAKKLPATTARSVQGSPLAEAPASGIEDDRAKLTAGARLILIIEDDPRFATILRDLAHEMGFQCVVAQTANEGLQSAARFGPNAILLDMNLPDHSGLGVLDQLKHNPMTRHIPVHVVSGTDYSQEALERGAIGYALKPVKREQLVEAFKRLEAKFSQSLRHVLVVEDDERQRESIRMLLSHGDVQITTVASAGQALVKLQSMTFDCMVMDLNLPDLSGYELLEKMAGQEEVSFPPVIVYTGRSLTRDEEQGLRRFSKAIIIKDARSPERLLDEVTLFLHQVESKLPIERQRMLKTARDRETTLEGRRILVVEDDVRNVFALSSILEPKGAKIEIARNGREALDALKRSGAQVNQEIDLVLMDIMMPEMDGLTAMREIRKNGEWKKLPIIALTAKAMKDDQEKCLAAGANDYIAKPLDVEKLLSLVRVWMPK